MADIIFHHYQNSPFSEKIRLIFGFKKLAWKSVVIPAVMPKPDLMPLTGGYRRTPVMQIGADIYCDTALIADVLDRMAPAPSLYPAAVYGLAKTLAQWADSSLFWTAIAYSFQPAGLQNVFAGMPPEQVQVFVADRTKFRNNAPRMALAEASGQLREMVLRLENMLADGRSCLLGATLTIADFSVYHAIWFVREVAAVGGIFEHAPALLAWADRMKAIGHATHENITAGDALEIARNSTPGDVNGRALVDVHGVALGEQVVIQASDYGADPIEGELVLADVNEIAVRRSDERAGTVVVHFPRLGFQLKRAVTA